MLKLNFKRRDTLKVLILSKAKWSHIYWHWRKPVHSASDNTEHTSIPYYHASSLRQRGERERERERERRERERERESEREREGGGGKQVAQQHLGRLDIISGGGRTQVRYRSTKELNDHHGNNSISISTSSSSSREPLMPVSTLRPAPALNTHSLPLNLMT